MDSVQQDAEGSSSGNFNKDNSLVLNLSQVEDSKSAATSLEIEGTSTTKENRALDKNGQTRTQDSVGRFFSLSFVGSLEKGYFNSVNDVYVKYSIVAGPDWVLGAGTDVGLTQIARFKKDKNQRQQFIWNQPISISYKSYNFFGWPQLVLSVYHFDTFGNDVILGYGCSYLPICKPIQQLSVPIFAPRSPSLTKRFLCFITGRKPELVNTQLIARPDCRPMDTRVSDYDSWDNITWAENLKRGFSHLLIHPFFPLIKYQFKLSCLFSGEPFCILSESPIVAEHESSEPIKTVSTFHRLEEFFNKTSLTSNLMQEFGILKNRYNSAIDHFKTSKHINILILIQLVLCIILLGYYLLRDVKYIWKYFRSTR